MSKAGAYPSGATSSKGSNSLMPKAWTIVKHASLLKPKQKKSFVWSVPANGTVSDQLSISSLFHLKGNLRSGRAVVQLIKFLKLNI
jgi:hypothetical protein